MKIGKAWYLSSLDWCQVDVRWMCWGVYSIKQVLDQFMQRNSSYRTFPHSTPDLSTWLDSKGPSLLGTNHKLYVCATSRKCQLEINRRNAPIWVVVSPLFTNEQNTFCFGYTTTSTRFLCVANSIMWMQEYVWFTSVTSLSLPVYICCHGNLTVTIMKYIYYFQFSQSIPVLQTKRSNTVHFSSIISPDLCLNAPEL